ncbi:hypothetical protein [Photobacterium leiognathi]|uniref:hypothetical protein n=1 Tax=Photobacterium leiognathi TaxID=553611 RepID=UPI0029822AFC|nr:hypothetical protein [Photobacterium leiognathi]
MKKTHKKLLQNNRLNNLTKQRVNNLINVINLAKHQLNLLEKDANSFEQLFNSTFPLTTEAMIEEITSKENLEYNQVISHYQAVIPLKAK